MVWRVHLLGEVRVVSGAREMTRFESRKVVALLARVALEPNRLHAREELAALLWPDADRRTGLERLRHILSSLQRQTAPLDAAAPTDPPLLVDRLGIRLNTAVVSCDAADFETAVRRRKYDEALALYTGDLLPGYYDDWIQDERERLRALYEQAEEQGTLPVRERDDAPAPAPRVTPVLSTRRVYLPQYLTAFFGRNRERQQLQELLATRRLVSVLGPGGCGKTRLSVEAGREAAAQFETVVFVPLADCVSPEQIPDRLRVALRLPAGGTETPLERVAVALGETPALIILDNLEQMATSGVGEVVEALLEQLPQAHCLVTTRMLLQVVGEQTFPLAPLPFPREGEVDPTPPSETLTDSVALFMDRARTVRPDFSLTSHNRLDVAALCRLLEGIPLALELAASRLHAYTVGEMRRQIEEEGRRFAVVTRPDAAVRKDPRHGSLWAALLWSWRLLTPRQQDFLASLSVLRGSFYAETAAAVCDVTDARGLLEELVLCSLVFAQEGATPDEGRENRKRFSLLETVREFAAEQLSPGRAKELHRAHAAHLLASAVEQLRVEDIPRTQGALDDALNDGMTDEALELCIALEEFWQRLGQNEVGLSFVRRALALPGGSTKLRSGVLAAGAYLASVSDVGLMAEFANAAWEAAGEDAPARAVAHLAQCRAFYIRRDAPEVVLNCLEEALALATAVNDPILIAGVKGMRGLVANRAGRFAEAEEFLLASQADYQALGQKVRANTQLLNLGVVSADRGEYALAHRRYEACLREARAMDDREAEGKLLNNIGALYAREERWDESIGALRECIRYSSELGSVYNLGHCLWNITEPLAYTGQGTLAIPALAYAQKFCEERDIPFREEDFAYKERVLEQAKLSLTADDSFDRLWAKGYTFALHEGVAFALGEGG
jgi:predicted ATPase